MFVNMGSGGGCIGFIFLLIFFGIVYLIFVVVGFFIGVVVFYKSVL